MKWKHHEGYTEKLAKYFQISPSIIELNWGDLRQTMITSFWLQCVLAKAEVTFVQRLYNRGFILRHLSLSPIESILNI